MPRTGMIIWRYRRELCRVILQVLKSSFNAAAQLHPEQNGQPWASNPGRAEKSETPFAVCARLFRKGHSFLSSLFSLWLSAKKSSVTSELYRKRLRFCESCRMYDPLYQTCGTPGELWENPMTKQREPFGCWCLAPLANLSEKNCWLSNYSGGNQGWPRALNSHPEFYE